MNTPQHTHEILTSTTGMYWDYHPTGGGCWALMATHKDGGTFVLTNENLTNEISPDEPVLLAYHDTPDTIGTGDGKYTDYNNAYEVALDYGNEALMWWCPTCKTTNLTTTHPTCRTCHTPQH